MITAIVPFSPDITPEIIEEFALHFGIVAKRIDKRDNTYLLETEEPASLFWFGCNISRINDPPPNNLSDWLIHTFNRK